MSTLETRAANAAWWSTLEILARYGVQFLVMVWPAFWWLDYYTGFHDYICATYPCIVRNERIIVFDLQLPLPDEYQRDLNTQKVNFPV